MHGTLRNIFNHIAHLHKANAIVQTLISLGLGKIVEPITEYISKQGANSSENFKINLEHKYLSISIRSSL